MSGQWEIAKPVFLASASADVMDDKRQALGVFLFADDHDVREIRRDGAGDEITG